MRLIDADKLIAFIDKGKYCNPNVLTFSENHLCEMINAQPTAYDVEKVVEELEKYRKLCFLTMANTGDEQLDNVYDYVSSAIEEAIDIVKRGGVDGSND